MSPNATKSDQVRREINYAIRCKKPLVAVHLVETNLPKAFQLQIGDIQAILKWRFESDQFYLKKLEESLPATLKGSISTA